MPSPNVPTDVTDALDRRVRRLERGRQRERWLYLVATSVLLVGACSSPGQLPRAADDVLRVRGLVVVDEAGTERIVLGAPLPDPPGDGQRVAASTGIAINDADGRERFGVGLMENGVFNMGFDGPPGTGDDRNRERVNIGVTPDGRGYIRFLDRETNLAGILYLDDADDFGLEIWDAGGATRGRLDVEGWRRLP